VSSWAEQVGGHPVHERLAELEGLLKQAKGIEVAQSDVDTASVIERSLSVVRFTRKRLSAADPSLISWQLLDNMRNSLDQAKAQVTQFVSNNNAGHLKNNARPHFDSIAQQCASIPIRLTKGEVEELSEAAGEFRNYVSALMSSVSDEKSAVDQRLSETSEGLEAAGEKLASLKHQVDAQEGRVSELVDAQKQAFSAEETERRQTFEEEKNGLLAQFQESARAVVDELESDKRKAAEIVQMIGSIGLTGNYQRIANKEARAANLLRAGAILFMVALAGLIVSMAFWAFPNGVPLQAYVFRFVSAAILAVPAGYLAFESARHRKIEIRMRRIQLELATLEPFLRELDTETSRRLREELAKKYFGRDADEWQPGQVPPTNLIDLLKYALEGIIKMKSS